MVHKRSAFVLATIVLTAASSSAFPIRDFFARRDDQPGNSTDPASSISEHSTPSLVSSVPSSSASSPPDGQKSHSSLSETPAPSTDLSASVPINLPSSQPPDHSTSAPPFPSRSSAPDNPTPESKSSIVDPSSGPAQSASAPRIRMCLLYPALRWITPIQQSQAALLSLMPMIHQRLRVLLRAFPRRRTLRRRRHRTPTRPSLASPMLVAPLLVAPPPPQCPQIQGPRARPHRLRARIKLVDHPAELQRVRVPARLVRPLDPTRHTQSNQRCLAVPRIHSRVVPPGPPVRLRRPRATIPIIQKHPKLLRLRRTSLLRQRRPALRPSCPTPLRLRRPPPPSRNPLWRRQAPRLQVTRQSPRQSRSHLFTVPQGPVPP
ncbi:hypothetical protein DFH07DRAFT_430527 [Mycena maculata]|uniref:Uncharacterized protein n=1 Tax=Mycena maculata TaxID=230809 RepID=A0AAD7JE22_9AGAR|nr:hypothetical protein DFH07DRAFT_430527 [Mycena maculata]